MSQPTIQRHGDTWSLAWAEPSVAMGMERLQETRDGVRAEITVESGIAGRVLGPVWLNILSSESQTRFANACAKRVNGQKPELWHALVVQACAIVAKQYRAPTPMVDLSQVDTSPEVEYLIPGLVPADETTVLYGDGESAKSLAALRIAASVSLGQPLPWDDRPTRTCPTLYLDWETNARTVAGRLKRIALGMVSSIPQVLYRQCFRSLHDELPSVREEVAKKGVGLVVVDSIGFAASGALTEDDTARSAMNALRQLSPATRLVVAHISADAARQTTGAARPFGSTFFWNGMRSGLELRRAEEGADPDNIELGLYHRKANDGEHHRPIGMSVLFDGRKGAIAFVKADVNDTPDLAARTTISSRLRRMLQQNKGPLSSEEFAEQLEVPIDTVTRTLRRMSDVVRVSEGGGRNHVATWGLQV
jgi:hypothetical protein